MQSSELVEWAGVDLLPRGPRMPDRSVSPLKPPSGRAQASESQWWAFAKYAALAGAGWMLDGCILLVLVKSTGLQPTAANVLSSCTAALAVFLISRQIIFRKADDALASRVLIYLAYTLVVIFLASVVLGLLVPWLRGWLTGSVEPRWAETVAAGVAKIAVTPPQLCLNFVMSRFFSERVLKVTG